MNTDRPQEIMEQPKLTRKNVREFKGRKIKCHYRFIPHGNSRDKDGDLFLSEDLILDIEDGTFLAGDFYLTDL